MLGLAVGVLLAWLMTLALTNLGLTFHVPYGQLLGFLFLAILVPYGQLLGFLFLAILVGVAGAVFPARRGLRIDVREALHHE